MPSHLVFFEALELVRTEILGVHDGQNRSNRTSDLIQLDLEHHQRPPTTADLTICGKVPFYSSWCKISVKRVDLSIVSSSKLEPLVHISCNRIRSKCNHFSSVDVNKFSILLLGGKSSPVYAQIDQVVDETNEDQDKSE